MTEERLATALQRASNAARRIEEAMAAMPAPATSVEGGDGAATLKAAIAPILSELDAMIAEAEGGTR